MQPDFLEPRRKEEGPRWQSGRPPPRGSAPRRRAQAPGAKTTSPRRPLPSTRRPRRTTRNRYPGRAPTARPRAAPPHRLLHSRSGCRAAVPRLRRRPGRTPPLPAGGRLYSRDPRQLALGEFPSDQRASRGCRVASFTPRHRNAGTGRRRQRRGRRGSGGARARGGAGKRAAGADWRERAQRQARARARGRGSQARPAGRRAIESPLRQA